MPAPSARRSRLARCAALLALAAPIALHPARARSADRFENVTDAAGVDVSRDSWGTAWGDFDSDGFADLYLNRHGAGVGGPRLLRNLRDGTFVDAAASVGLLPDGDLHGAAWADFDRDGDQDLVQIGGAAGSSDRPLPHALLVNQGQRFTDLAEALGVDQPLARGRTPLWWDWNRDGRLDLFVANLARADGLDPTTLFEQAPGGGFVPRHTLPDGYEFAQLSDLMRDGSPELLLRHSTTRLDVLDASGIPFVSVGPDLGLGAPTQVRDAAIADFDGDLLPDVFLARAPRPGSAWAITPAGELRASVRQEAEEIGIEFQCAAPITITLGSEWRGEVHVGAGGIALDSPFALDPSDPQHQGIAPHAPGARGVWVGYDPLRGVWVVRSAGARFGWFAMIVDPDAPISAVTPVGWSVEPDQLEDLLFLHGVGGRFEEVGAAAGVRGPTSCWSVTAGDFDDDMDVDLFLVCTGGAANTADRLYLNDGEGRFTTVPRAGGAAGTWFGRGDSVASADYDQDGFLDLVVTNGDGDDPLNDGPVELFRNTGNANHWLEIDLVGRGDVAAPAIGAIVLVTAGGRTQLREQDGGMHARTQDHTRLHFGLGPHAVAEEVRVVWPNGTTRILRNVAADQRMTIGSVACGLGPELALLAAIRPLLAAVRRRRSGSRA